MQQAIRDGRWTDAQVTIDRSRLSASADPELFEGAEVQAFKQRIDDAQQSLQQSEEQRAVYKVPEPLLRVRIEQERLEALRIRSNVVEDLTNSADRLSHQCNDAVAVQLLREALRLDPSNERVISRLRVTTERLSEGNAKTQQGIVGTHPLSQP